MWRLESWRRVRAQKAIEKASRLPARCGFQPAPADRSRGRRSISAMTARRLPSSSLKTRSDNCSRIHGRFVGIGDHRRGRKPATIPPPPRAQCQSLAGQLVGNSGRIVENSVARPSPVGSEIGKTLRLASTAWCIPSAPMPLWHGTPGKLIHNHQLVAFSDNILLIPVVKLPRNQEPGRPGFQPTVMPPRTNPGGDLPR